ncbi:Hypothetical protein LUCI_1062 [Lucifera butyrica]|uniref:DUF6917 domain-containing protein n=1 Tax=Lucifera butyrica TaxID=1351585 RepID=A0A498R384_9FIRM|nr:hypothetical protein [Lucifera butyrica]VBB05851.1 Hypothetical protein LUCI_1062 [Lucifera butyrica]
MKKDPYADGKFAVNPYFKKSDVTGALVVVLDGRMNNRGLELIIPISRCVVKDVVHELILTDEEEASPGEQVNRIAYLGFITLENSGVLVQGDEVHMNGRMIGHLAGFDETHMPNHLNLVIRTGHLFTGAELNAEPGMKITFHLPAKERRETQ